ncbi:unnamed protein product [Phytophthora lilii]|uniref:Unnamed protein product n=1 Tax=Phytophthora lilii TaxID=2077276 RepID=A0A9W6WZC8_9STRA|nr:unnamed protein product [Phytophthora lilii]
MTTHPTFYVGRVKRYHDPQGQNPVAEAEGSHEEEMAPLKNETGSQAQGATPTRPTGPRTQASTPAGDTRETGTPETLTRVSRTASRSTTGSTHTAAAPDVTVEPGGLREDGDLLIEGVNV